MCIYIYIYIYIHIYIYQSIYRSIYLSISINALVYKDHNNMLQTIYRKQTDQQNYLMLDQNT